MENGPGERTGAAAMVQKQLQQIEAGDGRDRGCLVLVRHALSHSPRCRLRAQRSLKPVLLLTA